MKIIPNDYNKTIGQKVKRKIAKQTGTIMDIKKCDSKCSYCYTGGYIFRILLEGYERHKVEWCWTVFESEKRI